MNTVFVQIRFVFALLIALAASGCATFDERVAEYQRPERWLTSVELAAKLPEAAKEPHLLPDFLAEYPIGTSYERRRCGTRVGNTICAIDAEEGGTISDEPLASSMPIITDYLLTGIYGPGRTVERQFRQAHIRHDLCYVHGLSTFGLGRTDCDADMAADLARLCDAIYAPDERMWCEQRRAAVLAAVSTAGMFFYYDNPQPVCEYEAKLGPARDFVLNGAFGEAPLAVVAPSADGKAIVVTRYSIGGDGVRPGSVASKIPLSDVTLWRPAYPHLGQHESEPLPVKLKDIAAAQDFLVYTPQVANIDGVDGDEIVLVGRQRRGDGAGYYGAMLMPIRFENGQATATQAFLLRALKDEAAQPTLATAQADGLDEALQHRFVTGEVDDQSGSDLVLASLATLPERDTKASETIEIRMFAFKRSDSGFDMKAAGVQYKEFPIMDPYQPNCRYWIGSQVEAPKLETHKRLQYDPILLDRRGEGADSKLMLLWRGKCQDRMNSSFHRQSTLLVDTVLLPQKWATLEGAGRSSLVKRVIAEDTGEEVTRLNADRLEGGMIERWGRETHPLMLARRKTETDMIGLSLCNFEEKGGRRCMSAAQASQGGFGDYPPANFVFTRQDDPYVVKPDGIYYAIPDMCVRPNDCKDRIKWKATGSTKKLFPEEYIVRPDPGQEPVTVTVGKKPKRVDYGAITSAYMVRASLVARVADGRDGIVMVWPKVAEAGGTWAAGSSLWSLLIIEPRDPGTKPVVKEIECQAPADFMRDPAPDAATQSSFTLMRSALLAARGPNEARDAIVAVRRAIGRDGSPTLVFGGVAPTPGGGYRTIDGGACQDSKFTWDAEIPTYPAVTTLSSKQ